MENTMRISFSAVSHTGAAREVNTNRIFASGRFNNSFDNDNLRVSLEATDTQFIFALSDCMESEGPKTSSSISINDDLKKFQQKYKNNPKDLQTRHNELAEYVQQTGKLFSSMSDESDYESSPSFAGLMLESGRYGILKLGDYSIFKLENDVLRPLASDQKRTERLLKMGIINDEQAEMIFGQTGGGGPESKSHIKKSDIYPLREGDTFLICSKGILDAVSEDALFDIMASNRQIDEAAALIVKEATGNFGSDNMTAMIIRADETDEIFEKVEAVEGPVHKHHIPRRAERYVQKPASSFNASRLVSAAVIIIIAAAVIFGAVSLWMNINGLQFGKFAFNGNPSASSAENTNGDEINSVDPNTGTGSDQQDGTTADNPADTLAGTSGDASGTNPGGGSDSNVSEGVTSSITSDQTYTVRTGDNLMLISKKFYGTQNQYKLIMQANGLDNPDKIFIGQVLKIPEAN
jgi:nucleoid-associated protein YgaU